MKISELLGLITVAIIAKRVALRKSNADREYVDLATVKKDFALKDLTSRIFLTPSRRRLCNETLLVASIRLRAP